MNKDDKSKIKEALQDLPGAAIDSADNETVTKAEVDARTKAQNNNPRNNDAASPERGRRQSLPGPPGGSRRRADRA